MRDLHPHHQPHRARRDSRPSSVRRRERSHTSRQDRPLHGVHPQLMSNIPNGRASLKDKSVTLDPAVVTALPAPDPAFHPQRPRQDWSDRYPLVVAPLGALRLRSCSTSASASSTSATTISKGPFQND